MAYDEVLAARLRERFTTRPGASERRMFGALLFFTNGNMTIGVAGDDLIVRLGASAAEAARQRPGVGPYELTTRPMRNWVRVEGSSLDDQALDSWLAEADAFVSDRPA